MNTNEQCSSYAMEAMQYSKSYTFPHMRGPDHNQAECERAIIFCANRIIALRTAEAAAYQFCNYCHWQLDETPTSYGACPNCGEHGTIRTAFHSPQEVQS